MTEERWFQMTYWPLIVASFVFILLYSIQVIWDLGSSGFWWGTVVIGVTWVMFAIDYLVRLGLSPRRLWWFRHHIFDLLVVVIPPLKPLRLLRALTLISAKRQTVGAALRSRLTVYGAGAAAVLIWIAALSVLDNERHAPGANILNFEDAVWWAFVTITTVGYGDFYPVTGWGRMTAVFLMSGGVAVVGVVTATLASWVVERAAVGRDDEEPATRRQVRELSVQLTDFLARGSEPPPQP